MKTKRCLSLFLLILFESCKTKAQEQNWADANFRQNGVFQRMSLFGDSLVTQVDNLAKKDRLLKLFIAKIANAGGPILANLIRIGREEAYLDQYDLTSSTFTKGIGENKNAFETLRHR